jgi:hypothetical protein
MQAKLRLLEEAKHRSHLRSDHAKQQVRAPVCAQSVLASLPCTLNTCDMHLTRQLEEQRQRMLDLQLIAEAEARAREDRDRQIAVRGCLLFVVGL